MCGGKALLLRREDIVSGGEDIVRAEEGIASVWMEGKVSVGGGVVSVCVCREGRGEGRGVCEGRCGKFRGRRGRRGTFLKGHGKCRGKAW